MIADNGHPAAATLLVCVTCKSDEGPLGDATFAWHLTPHFKK